MADVFRLLPNPAERIVSFLIGYYKPHLEIQKLSPCAHLKDEERVVGEPLCAPSQVQPVHASFGNSLNRRLENKIMEMVPRLGIACGKVVMAPFCSEQENRNGDNFVAR